MTNKPDDISVKEKTFYDINLRHEVSQVSSSLPKGSQKDLTSTNNSNLATPDVSQGFDTQLQIITGIKCERDDANAVSLSQKEYVLACRKLKLMPSKHLLASLQHHKITVNNQRPNELEVLAFSIGLIENLVITQLHLCNNDFNEKCILYICAALWENNSIRTVEISGNKLSDRSLKELVELFSVSNHICCVDISNNEIQDKHGPLIAELIKENRCIRQLNLSHNYIGDSTCHLIGKALSGNSILLNFDLSWNTIRTKGAEDLINGLMENFVLKSLNLSMNGISNEGAGLCARLLAKNTTIIELDISNNRIYDVGIGYVSKMILKNDSLICLKIAYNPITTAGVHMLMKAILNNIESPLRELDLSGVYLDKESEITLNLITSQKAGFVIDLHGIVSSQVQYKSRTANNGILNLHPSEILRLHIEKTGNRLIDVFRIFDRNNNNLITRADFVQGLEIMNIPLTDNQVDEIFNSMGSSDGSFNFGMMMENDKDARMRLRRKKEKIKANAELQTKKLNFDDI